MKSPAVDDLTNRLDRLHRQALKRERTVLATVLTTGDAELLPLDYHPHHPIHRDIVDAVRALPADQDCGLRAVAEELERQGALTRVGIIRLAEITDAPTVPPLRSLVEQATAEAGTLWDRYDAAVAALQEAETVLQGVCDE